MEEIEKIVNIIVFAWADGEKLISFLLAAGAFVTSLAIAIRLLDACVKTLHFFANLTPTDVDNKVLSKVGVLLSSCAASLDKLGTDLASIPKKLHGR
ncbi:MAG: hypothetical protein MN733_40430 [Nitrososphaera sp.]|nr:hypothetical protein [Nitrososphaera sp.]